MGEQREVRIVSPGDQVEAGEWVAFRTPREPRVWAMPPEPGPEVKAVRTAAGQEWQRSADLWWVHGVQAVSWALLLSFGPLTEVVDTDG